MPNSAAHATRQPRPSPSALPVPIRIDWCRRAAALPGKTLHLALALLWLATERRSSGVRRREGIAISRDGRGRALDNSVVERLWRSVKDDDVSLKGYASLPELLLGLTDYYALPFNLA